MQAAWSLALVVVLGVTPTMGAGPDIVVADFEGTDWGGWTKTGNCFGDGPAQGTLPGQMDVSGYLGHGLASSFVGGDDTTGDLTSPPFKLERPYLKFLIGGGGYAGKTCLELLLDGKVVRSATGPNVTPGGSERLSWAGWSVGEYLGKTVQLRIADRATGGWGHINVDQIVQSNRSAEIPGMQFNVEHTYLYVPIKRGATNRSVRLTVNGHIVRSFDVALGAPESCDWWANYDISAYRGFAMTITVLGGDNDLDPHDYFFCGDAQRGLDNLHREAGRPQFHLTPARGWNNDPNGMVYADGQWHVFYQQNPFGIDWGNMHWGHFVSPDLVHWREAPTAIYPCQPSDGVFSGGAVFDEHNTAGFALPGQSAIVATFTSTSRGECLAYSTDGGCTFHDYPGNPVYHHNGRDPKVVWYAPDNKWVMIVFDETDGARRYQLLESTDLKKWTLMSTIDGFFECPNFFSLPLDGDATQTKWIVDGHAWRTNKDGAGYGTHNSYQVGAFDGKTFKPETDVIDGHFGPNFYAAEVFNNTPDGRVIMVGWLNGGAYPGMPFSQGMTVPLELSLVTTPAGPRLRYYPARELAKLHTHAQKGDNLDAAAATKLLQEIDSEFLDVDVSATPAGEDFELTLRGIPVRWVAADSTLHFRDQVVPCPLIDGELDLRVLVDRGVMEVFAQRGLVALADARELQKAQKPGNALAGGGQMKVKTINAAEMRSVWPEAK